MCWTHLHRAAADRLEPVAQGMHVTCRFQPLLASALLAVSDMSCHHTDTFISSAVTCNRYRNREGCRAGQVTTAEHAALASPRGSSHREPSAVACGCCSAGCAREHTVLTATAPHAALTPAAAAAACICRLARRHPPNPLQVLLPSQLELLSLLWLLRLLVVLAPDLLLHPADAVATCPTAFWELLCQR